MKDFVFAANDAEQTTTSTSLIDALALQLPGNQLSPQDWLVIWTWEFRGAVVDTEYEVSYDLASSAAVVVANQRAAPPSSVNRWALGAFHVFRDLPEDVDLTLKYRKASGGGSARIKNARILAIRIPKGLQGTFEDVWEDFTASPSGSPLEPAAARTGWAKISKRVQRGRYLVLGSVDIDAPAASASIITAGLEVLNTVVSSGPPKQAVSHEQRIIPPTLTTASGGSLVRLGRPTDAAVDRRHSFMCMGVVELEDEHVVVQMMAQTDSATSPSPYEVQSARTCLIPLDGNWEYEFGHAPDRWSYNGDVASEHLKEVAGRTMAGAAKDTARLGFAVVAHDTSAAGATSQGAIQDQLSPATELVSTRVDTLGYADGAIEMVLATMTADSGSLDLTKREPSGVSPGEAHFAAGMILSLIDVKSGQTDLRAERELVYDWDLAGALDGDPADIFQVLKMQRLAEEGKPVTTIQRLELVNECVSRGRFAVTDSLLRNNG